MEDIELRDVKIAKDFYVPKDKVKYYAAYSGEFIINDVRKMRKTEPGKCKGCKHVQLIGMYPCSCCSVNGTSKNYYEKRPL